MNQERKNNESFVKIPFGFSYVLSPEQERFVKHLKEIEYLRRMGQKVDFTRAEYMKRMGLREFTFDKCAASLCRLGLVVKSADSGRNRVNYRLNGPVYDRLAKIVSTTRHIDKLTQFFDFHVVKLGKSIEQLTDGDIEALAL
ncbi:MAG: hypothetical protein LBV18_03080 [Alistipes sp.]|jgi:hypothetical protein|nr:hypothetical protein [Alistipes sp.]